MRKFNVNVNGKLYYVEVEEQQGSTPVPMPSPKGPVQAVPAATPSPAPVATKAVEAGSTVVKAPMPGQILELCVSAGASVNKGDKIVILEAMKMENEIVAPVSGVVTYLVKKGDSVDTDASLAYIK